MSLGDIMGLATNAQAYKQAQQINPQTLRTATANAQSAEQTAATGGIDLQVAQQKNDERLVLQDFFSNPDNFQTNGQMDINKINAAVPKIAPLTGTDVIKKIADVSQTQTTAKESSQKFKQNTRALVANTLSVAGRSGNNKPEYYKAELDNLLSSDPNNKELNDYVTSQKKLIDMAPPGTDLANGAIIHSQELLSAPEQQEAFAPKAGTADLGGAVYTTEIQPSVGTNKPTIKLGPKLASKTLPLTVVTSETGAPRIIGGDNGGGVGNVGGGTSQSGVQPATQPGAGKKAIPYVPGEPYDAFKTRAADVAKMIPQSAQALNINNVDSIPNAKFTNEKVQHLLDNPNLNIGPIADAISKKTGGIGLSADQQEIAKYLEQRIRMESARTNQDQTSQRTAFGSFGTQKATLREILYKDQGNLTGQELYQRGILNHAGDINNPNFQAVNKFNADYAKLNDPKVAHLMGVIGDKSISDLSKVDRQHLAKEFPGLSLAQSKALFDKRQQLLDLVGGK